MEFKVFDDMDQCTESEVQRMLPLVSEQRRRQALQFRFLFGQYACLKSALMLAEISGLEPAKMAFGFMAHGKPYVIGHPDIHFSLSHCERGIAVAIDQEPVGIDIEGFIVPEKTLVDYTMNHDEVSKIAVSDNPNATFIAIWTRKEAVLKLRGTGLTDDLHHVLQDCNAKIMTNINYDKQYALSVAQ